MVELEIPFGHGWPPELVFGFGGAFADGICIDISVHFEDKSKVVLYNEFLIPIFQG